MSNILEGPLGVVQLYLRETGSAVEIDLGKTTAATELSLDHDWLDIIYQQTGTKPADKVETGKIIMITAAFGEITNALLNFLDNGNLLSDSGETLVFSTNQYTSLLDTNSYELIIKKVLDDGTVTLDDYETIIMYKVLAEITGAVNFDAASQKNLAVSFYCFKQEYTNSITALTEQSFGYIGVASSAGVPSCILPKS